MPTTLYEYAGGDAAFLALATAHHARCLADPELNHPFTHADSNPEHIARLAAYWAEVMGGPRTYTTKLSSQPAMLAMHCGNGDMGDLGRRFEQCFALALGDAHLPEDDAFRITMNAYMAWAVADVLASDHREGSELVEAAMPHWTWDGLVAG